MWGETCRWAAILSDAAFVSVLYITVKIPWVQRVSQYLEGQLDYPSQIRILLYLTRFWIRCQVRYPSYGPWHRARAARVPRQVLPQGAKTRARVFADTQNFALRAHCVHGIPIDTCWPAPFTTSFCGACKGPQCPPRPDQLLAPVRDK